MRRAVAMVVLLTTLMVPDARAQLRGIVRDSTLGNGLAGAVVQVLDSANRSGARTITDPEGRFAVPLTPSSVRLRILRIGYRPIETPVLADRIGPVDVRMSCVPPILDAVRVSDSELCPGSPERGAAFEIWQQARTGLLATIVAREMNPARASTLTYTTNLAPRDERVRRQKKTLISGRTTRPFVASAQPSFFARMGYMLEDGPTRIFNAPDADVLIDESFAATHCFHLRGADSAHPGQVGLAFTPVAGRDTLVDVDGVIWVDAATPQLRSLDFAYTSLEPAAMDAEVGGHIEFKTMPNGVSFIDRWNLRLAGLEQPIGTVHRTTSPGTRVRRTELSEVTLKELVDAGGVVLTASWGDGTRWEAVKSVVSGVVAGKGGGPPVAGAIVTLAGTPDTVKTDSVGRFRIETIPGNYLLEAVDTAFGTFVKPRAQSTPVQIRLGETTTARLEVEPVARIVADICRGQHLRPGSSMIEGAVAIDGADLPKDAFVEASFQFIEATIEASSGMTQRISPDDDGRFVVCGTPRDRKVHLRLKTPQGRVLGDTAVIVPRDSATHRVIWVVPPVRP
jgi:hypothetical protein